MEPVTGAPLRAHGLRPLNLPRPVEVDLDAHGLPMRVVTGSLGTLRTYEVEQVQEVWRVAEAWWRAASVQRTYYQVVIDSGRTLTLFHDDEEHLAAGWYEQRY
jgi:hypothetical protein